MPYELQSEEVRVCGETLTVWEASNLMETKRSFMIEEADKKWKADVEKGVNDKEDARAESLDIEAESQRYLETLLYPSLVACTTGNIPAIDEFVNNVPASDTVAWADAARRKNPRWFPDLSKKTPEQKQAELEKKES